MLIILKKEHLDGIYTNDIHILREKEYGNMSVFIARSDFGIDCGFIYLTQWAGPLSITCIRMGKFKPRNPKRYHSISPLLVSKNNGVPWFLPQTTLQKDGRILGRNCVNYITNDVTFVGKNDVINYVISEAGCTCSKTEFISVWRNSTPKVCHLFSDQTHLQLKYKIILLNS